MNAGPESIMNASTEPNVDHEITEGPCPECGQGLYICKSCKQPKAQQKRGFVFVFVFTTLVTVLFMAAYVILLVVLTRDPKILASYLGNNPENTWHTLACVGEMFGGVNCFVSAFAFAALVYSLRQQRIEIGIQQQGTREMRREMKLSIQAQKDSAVALAHQIEQMRITARIDALGAMVRSFDTQIHGQREKIARVESVADALQIASDRDLLGRLQQQRDAVIAQLQEAIREISSMYLT